MNQPSYFFISLMNGAAWGGSEELWYKTALFLAEKKINVACAVFEWKEKEDRLKKLEAAGCKVYRLPNKRLISARGLRKFLLKQKTKRQLLKTLKELPVEEYETVIINQGGYEIMTNPWIKFYKRLKQFAVLFHNYSEGQKFSANQKKTICDWVKSASVNLFAAEKAKTVLEEQLDCTISNADVFINPITIQVQDEMLRYPSLKNGNFVFSVFAALDVSRKAQNKLIEVLSEPKWKHRDWLLNFYGEGNDRDYLQNLISEKGLETKVFLKGHTNNVLKALGETHLVLQITNVDAMPLSVMEAMAVGRPLVVSNVGDMPLWVREGQNGWICEPFLRSIDACLEKAWQESNKWESMAKTSFQIFQEKFPKKVEEKFLQQLNITRY